MSRRAQAKNDREQPAPSPEPWRGQASAVRRKLPRNLPDLIDQRVRISLLEDRTSRHPCFVCGAEGASKRVTLHVCPGGCEGIALELFGRPAGVEAEKASSDPAASRRTSRRSAMSKRRPEKTTTASGRPASRKGRPRR